MRAGPSDAASSIPPHGVFMGSLRVESASTSWRRSMRAAASSSPTVSCEGLAAHVTLLSTEPDIATVAARLALPRGDPFDRMIVATALHHELTLGTADLAITESKLVPVLW